MPIAMIVMGFGLVIAGVWFAVGGFGTAAAQGTAIKGISISGPSWLILVALGVAVIMGGAWMHRGNQQQQQDPAPAPALYAEPYTYGDDPALDLLYESCSAEDMQACDTLYQQAPAGSEYEYYGATCGERTGADSVFCVDADIAKLPHSD